MSTKEMTNIYGRQLLPHEIAYVDTMSKILAKESGIKVEWIKSILIKTFPSDGIGIHRPSVKGANTFISGKFPGRFLYCFKPCLLESMKWLDKDYIIELFSGDLQHLQILEDRYNSVINEVPFVSFRKLLPTAKKFRAYLEEEFETIIETGSIPANRRFESYYLENTFLQSFLHRRQLLKSIQKKTYLEKHKKFEDGVLTDDFLEKLLGPEYYREYGEVITAFDYLDPKKSSLEAIPKWRTSLGPLEEYLEANKLKRPTNLKKRDELLRANLHKFSQDALDAFINSHRDHEQGTVLRKIWGLIRAMPFEQLDLIFNGNLSYLGIAGHSHDNPNLYTYGRALVEKILIAAALDDQSIQSDSIKNIKIAIEDVIDDFIESDTGELKPITYSVYQAIYLCNYNSVTNACSEFASAKEKLNNLRETIKKGTQHTLNLSFSRLEEIRREVIQFEYLSSLGIENGIAVGATKAKPNLKESFFTDSYSEYHSRNPKYPIFKFGVGLKSKAVKRLHQAYKTAARGLTSEELISSLYTESRSVELKKRRKNPWNLFKDIFDDVNDPAIAYGMIRRGEQIEGANTYILDFSFEDRDPEEQIREYRKAKSQSKKENRKPAKKSEGPHPWKDPITEKAKDKRKKKTLNKSSSMWDRYSGDDQD